MHTLTKKKENKREIGVSMSLAIISYFQWS